MQFSKYKGSATTAALVKAQIMEKWGAEVAAAYSPLDNVFTYRGWSERSRVVRKGEKALRSITIVEKKDNSGNVIKRYRKNVFLFHYLQTEPLTKSI